MDYESLQLIRYSLDLSEAQFGRRLATNQKTAHRWLTGYTNIPATIERLIDCEFGDDSNRSALKAAKQRIRDSWHRFVMQCPAEELALVVAGAQAAEFTPDVTDLFSLTSYDESNTQLVYVGDVCGMHCEPLIAASRLLAEIGRDEDADRINDFIIGMEDDNLRKIITPMIGAMEREEMLRYDIISAVETAIVNDVEQRQ